MRNGHSHHTPVSTKALKQKAASARHRLAESAHEARTSAREATEAGAEAARDIGAATRQWAEDIGEILRHRATTVSHAAREQAARVRETARRRAAYAREVAMRRMEEAEPLKGFAAGMIGGLAGSFAMNLFFKWVSSHSSEEDSDQSQDKELNGNREPATVEAAERLSEKAFHHELSPKAKRVAGPAMHYGFGAMMGGLYGSVSEYVPEVTAGGGLAYGTLLFIAADEIAVPALGLAPKPTEVRAAEHAKALTAHLIYGGTTEIVRKLVRPML